LKGELADTVFKQRTREQEEGFRIINGVLEIDVRTLQFSCLHFLSDLGKMDRHTEKREKNLKVWVKCPTVRLRA